jgi:hypothetical protein
MSQHGGDDPEDWEFEREVHLHHGELLVAIERVVSVALDRTKPRQARERALAWLHTVAELARALEETKRR